ncbi:MAG: phage tail terminator-like protein [Rhizomicrobium sp.]
MDEVYDAIVAYLKRPETSPLIVDPITSDVPPIRYENEPFVKPEPPKPWVAVSLSGIVYGQASIGAHEQADNRWDEAGQLWLPVFVPSGSGSSRARQLAKQLANLFRGLTLLDGSLEFMDAFIGTGAPSEEKGSWYELPVSIEWRRIEA